MKRTYRLLATIVMLLALGTLKTPGVVSQDPTPPSTFAVPGMLAVDLPQGRTTGRPDLESSLSQLIDVYEAEGLDAARTFGTQRGMVLEEERVQVVLVGESEAAMDAIRDAVLQAGGDLQSSYESLQQAMVPIGALESLVGRVDVRFIREPRRPVPVVGAQTTEGVAASNANTWHTHTAAWDGTGVDVAIIDIGFSGYAGLLSTDLPASVTTQDYTANWPGTSPHGTACAEIVYDMAYGANMYLVKIATDLDLGNAVNWLIGQGVDVISMSLGWTIDGPGDGTGNLANIVNNARTNGIFFATAAGNDREVMWHGTYVDSGTTHPTTGNPFHAWDGATAWYNFMGSQTPGSCVMPSAGAAVAAGLHWDNWTHPVNQDYDLHLYRWPGSGTTLYWVASSTSAQNGGVGQTPEEYVSATASGSDCYCWVVERVNSSRDVCLRLAAPKMGSMNYWVTSRSLTFPADSSDAMTVGAVDVTTYAQEYYSSEGPTFGAGGVCSGGSTKPDVAGYARVSTVSYGAGGFAGTSAATPHVAGGAALYIQAYAATTGGGTPPTPAQTQTYLETNAQDLGTPGRDNQYGAGRLWLGSLGPNVVGLTALGTSSGPDAVLPLSVVGLCAIAGLTAAVWFRRKRKTG